MSPWSPLNKTTVSSSRPHLFSAVINIADSSVVSSARSLDLFIREIVAFELADMEQSATVRVLVFFLDFDLRQIDVDPFVHVPILFLDCVRVVRMGKGNGQAERPA